MRVLFVLVIFVATVHLSASAQKHDHLRQIYLRLSEDSAKLDSALFLAFKVRDAAIKEYGKRSMSYFRALNNIGYVYNNQNRNNNARYWWLRCYNELKSVDQNKFESTRSIIYNNLRVVYVYHFPNPDSAALFVNKYIALREKQHKTISREFLNWICMVAQDFQTTLNSPLAEKYYTKALEIRAQLIGQRSTEIVKDIDSVIIRNNVYDLDQRRYQLYTVFDVAHSYKELDSISKIEEEKNTSWDAVYYTAELVDASIKLYGDTSSKFITGLHRLGNIYYSFLKEEHIALYCLNKSLSILKENNAEHTEKYIEILTDIGHIYSIGHHFNKAIPIGDECLRRAERISGKQSKFYARILASVGLFYKNFEQLDELYYSSSSRYLRESADLKKKLYGQKSKEYGEALTSLGNANIRYGKLDSAEFNYLKAYDILKGLNYKYLSTICKQLHYTYDYKDETAKSNLWLQKVNDLSQLTGDTVGTGYFNTLFSLAFSSIELNDFKKASNDISKMNKLLNGNFKESSWEYERYRSLQALYGLKKGEYSGLDTLLLLNIKMMSDSTIYDQNSPDSRRERSKTYTTLADIYIHQKKYDEALHVNFLAYKDVDLDSGSIFIIKQKGTIMKYMNRSDSAIHYYQKALNELTRDSLQGNEMILSHFRMELATLYQEYGMLDTAENIMAKAIKEIKTFMVKNMAGFNEKEKQQYNLALQQNLYKYYTLQRALYKKNPQVNTTAFNLIIQSKGLLINSSSYLAQAISASADTILKNKYEGLIKVHKELAKLYQSNAATSSSKSSLDSLQAQANRLEQELSFNSPVFASFQKENNIDVRQVQSSLTSSEAGIEFIEFPFFSKGAFTDSILYAAFIVKNKGEAVYVPLTENYLIKNLIKGQGVEGRGATTENLKKEINSSVYHQLYEILWEPLSPHLKGIKKIYIASDGIVNNVSFACLQNQYSKYLIDKYDLNFVLSTKDISKLKTYNFSMLNPSVALFGGAQYSLANNAITTDTLMGNRSLPDGLRGGISWNYLPNTLTEVQKISELLKSKNWTITSYTGESASEENFKKLNGDQAPTILHIATHGFYFPLSQTSKQPVTPIGSSSAINFVYDKRENPLLRTGLVFSSANDVWLGKGVTGDQEDGILTAYEFANMSLSDTKLAVLSACETGIGEVVNGEGVFGLQRAIKQAGISKMMVSLWPVPDKETSEMMQEFYSQLATKGSVTQAFSLAQKTMRKRYPHQPVLWAGFVLIQ